VALEGNGILLLDHERAETFSAGDVVRFADGDLHGLLQRQRCALCLFVSHCASGELPRGIRQRRVPERIGALTSEEFEDRPVSTR
jgi:hypothetical protein